MLKIHAAFIPAAMVGAEGTGVTLPEWGTAHPSRSFTVATDGLFPKFCAPPAGVGKLLGNEPVRSRVLRCTELTLTHPLPPCRTRLHAACDSVIVTTGSETCITLQQKYDISLAALQALNPRLECDSFGPLPAGINVCASGNLTDYSCVDEQGKPLGCWLMLPLVVLHRPISDASLCCALSCPCLHVSFGPTMLHHFPPHPTYPLLVLQSGQGFCHLTRRAKSWTPLWQPAAARLTARIRPLLHPRCAALECRQLAWVRRRHLRS